MQRLWAKDTSGPSMLPHTEQSASLEPARRQGAEGGACGVVEPRTPPGGAGSRDASSGRVGPCVRRGTSIGPELSRAVLGALLVASSVPGIGGFGFSAGQGGLGGTLLHWGSLRCGVGPRHVVQAKAVDNPSPSVQMASTPSPKKPAAPAKKKAAASKVPKPKRAAGARDVWAYTFSADPSVSGVNDVMTLRHATYGTGLELWQGSFGWFDFLVTAKADVVLCDSWGVQMKRNTKVFSLPKQFQELEDSKAGRRFGDEEFTAGRLRPMLNKTELQSALAEQRRSDPLDPAQFGSWTFSQSDDLVVVRNKQSKRQRLLLTADGFVFIGAMSKAVRVDKGQEALDFDVRDVIHMLPKS